MQIWISGFAAIAALITAIATLLTINEMRKQRKSSLIPELTFPKNHFFIYWFNPNKGVPLFWSKNEIEKPEKDVHSAPSTKSYFNVKIECFNVGFGVAKEVEISWDFDIKNFINVLKELDDGNKFKFALSEDAYLRIHSSDLDYLSILNRENFEPSEIRYLLPAQMVKEPTLLRIPSEYITLYSIYIYLLILTETQQKENIPSLNVSLTFKDLESETYTNKFELTPSIPAIWGWSSKDKWSKAGEVEFEVKENT